MRERSRDGLPFNVDGHRFMGAVEHELEAARRRGVGAFDTQHAAITALTGPQEDMQVMKEAFEKRRDHLVERMNRIEGVSCIKPEGAFYVMMNMTGFIGKTMYGKVIESAEDFSQLFLEKGLVATVPCTAFAAPGFVRWSYATSLTEIDKGLDRLEEFIKNA